MTGAVRVRLAIMMFIQYALWGAWAPILALYLGGLESFREDTGWKINLVYMTMAIASMISPFIAGQLADRYFSTEKYLAFSHLAGGVLLLAAAQAVSFEMIFWIMLAHCLLYAPTVPLTNSLSFHHLPNAEKEFGAIRLWGTIGWIAGGWLFAGWLALPLLARYGFDLTASLPRPPSVGDCLYFGGGLSLVMAAYCLTLPHTPPTAKAENPLAFLTAIKLAKDRSFAVLLVVAFLVSTELQFYYTLTPNFFGDQPGPSLSQSELMTAVGLDPKDPASREQATVLMRLLDINRNNKLSAEELQQAADRLRELQAARDGMTEQPQTLRDIQRSIEKFGLAIEARSAETIAGYVLTAADDNQDQHLTPQELQSFLDRSRPLQDKAALALSRFEAHASSKGGLHLSSEQVPLVMSLGQIAEIVVLLLLPWSLSRLGFGLTIAIGIAAWSVRYAIFALGQPLLLVVASQTLHGFGFGFFFVGAMIYSDRIAPRDIRASAQSLIIFVTYGAGMVVSSLIAGPVADYFQFDWHKVFLVPVAITAFCTLLFLIGFRESRPAEEEKKPADAIAPVEG